MIDEGFRAQLDPQAASASVIVHSRRGRRGTRGSRRQSSCCHDGSRERRPAAARRHTCGSHRRPLPAVRCTTAGRVPRSAARIGLPAHPTRSVYVSSEITADLELDARAWALALPPSAAMFGTTAAAWYGLPVPRDEAFHVIVPAGRIVPRRRAGLARDRRRRHRERRADHSRRNTGRQRGHT